jgi:hypothetical protein
MSRDAAAYDRSVTPCRITPCQSTSPLVTRPKRDVMLHVHINQDRALGSCPKGESSANGSGCSPRRRMVITWNVSSDGPLSAASGRRDCTVGVGLDKVDFAGTPSRPGALGGVIVSCPTSRAANRKGRLRVNHFVLVTPMFGAAQTRRATGRRAMTQTSGPPPWIAR